MMHLPIMLCPVFGSISKWRFKSSNQYLAIEELDGYVYVSTILYCLLFLVHSMRKNSDFWYEAAENKKCVVCISDNRIRIHILVCCENRYIALQIRMWKTE